MEYQIRKVTPEDITQLMHLIAAHALYERATFNPEGKSANLLPLICGPQPRLFCLVVEVRQVLVGFATFSNECSTWDAALFAHMDCLYLEADYRGKGIGKKLVQAIVSQVITDGITIMQWQTPTFNESAIRFYHRLGATSKDKKRFYLENQQLINLV